MDNNAESINDNKTFLLGIERNNATRTPKIVPNKIDKSDTKTVVVIPFQIIPRLLSINSNTRGFLFCKTIMKMVAIKTSINTIDINVGWYGCDLRLFSMRFLFSDRKCNTIRITSITIKSH